jgi:hypothetical protein
VWCTPMGTRYLDRGESELVRAALGLVVELVEDDDSWVFGVRVFDALQPEQKLALLADVGTAVLRPDSPTPPRSVMRDAAIAVIYGEIVTMIAAEIDEENLGGTAQQNVRTRLREICSARPDLTSPRVDDAELNHWVPLVQALEDRMLTSDIVLHADLYLDADPERARAMRRHAGVDGDYFMAIVHDPTNRELNQIRATLRRLTEGLEPHESPNRTTREH